MGKASTTVTVGLEMANPAESEGMRRVLATYPDLLPVIPGSRAIQPTVLWCDQNFFERGGLDFFYFVYFVLFQQTKKNIISVMREIPARGDQVWYPCHRVGTKDRYKINCMVILFNGDF